MAKTAQEQAQEQFTMDATVEPAPEMTGQEQFQVQVLKTTVADVATRNQAQLGGGVHVETHQRTYPNGGTEEVQVITQEGYGPWPTCSLCGDQVEPTGYAMHVGEHDKAALKAAGKL